MPTQVIMPQLGESVVEGTVSKWLKAKGDAVEEYEPLLEVNTDKVDSEIPCPVSGVLLDILVEEGTTVHAGTVLALIGGQGERAGDKPTPRGAAVKGNGGEATKNVAATKTAAQEASAPTPGRDLGFISPVVAKIAHEQGVDLSQVQGTGLGGRITKKDVLAYVERTQEADRQVEEPAPALSPAPERPSLSPLPSTPTPMPGEVLPLTAVRRAIAEHMVHSKRTSPHVTTVMEADLSRVTAHRSTNKEAFARDGATLTYTVYFISAIVSALKAYPVVNSSWAEAGVLLHREINIGMAVSLGEAGLIVPVIKHADGLSLLGLARAVNDLADRARARQLKPDEVKGGTFTLTNHGTSGSLFATPIINQPQCAILGVGAIQKRVVVVTGAAGEDAIAIRPMAYVSLTFDHRILDGAVADYFLGKVVELLQNWN
jgi:2-oxoglutarate dehydrogenase E2 component (dihydrolipoamide succinyltransferase)